MLDLSQEDANPAESAKSTTTEAATPVEKTVPISHAEADAAAAETESLADKTMTMSRADLKFVLEAGSKSAETAIPVAKTVPSKREDAKPAEEAGAAPVQVAKPVEKKAPAQETAADSEGDEKPEGRLLPWEPAAPAEGSEATDK
jgi:hypothetical protein